MINSKNKILTMMRRATDEIDIRDFIFAGIGHKPSQGFTCLPVHRLVVPLSGVKHVCLNCHGRKKWMRLRPGQILFAPAFSWTLDIWDSKLEIISLVFHNEYTRVLYIDQFPNMPRLGPDIYYHTNKPISQTCNYLLRSLELLTERDSLNSVAADIATAIVKLTINEVEQSRSSQETKARQTWKEMVDYIAEHITENVGRAELVEHFEMHPSYISKLFSTFSGQPLQDYITELKMMLAKKLIIESDATIESIAQQCGYRYTSYFIKTFKKIYGKSPGEFRISTSG